MSEHHPTRVRVTAPRSRPLPSGARPTAAREIESLSPLGEVFVESLVRTQLRLALRTIAALGLLVGGVPLALDRVPGLAERHLLGLPLPWAALALLVYPVLVLLGWGFVRAAERNEQDFAALLTRPGHESRPTAQDPDRPAEEAP